MNSNKHTNNLIHESSPYLLQHAHNPVNWFPWGEEALNKAAKEDKPLIISIGYAACHWCHVMEKESFEDEEIAKLMNAHFVSIKIDREERPDIDQVYMEAVQVMNGNGGWPLNCFALPGGEPFYGGTYFPKQHWAHILQSIANMYKEDRQRITEVAANLTGHLNLKSIDYTYKGPEKISFNDLNQGIENWKPYFDKIFGGNKRSPKFPMPSSLLFLMHFGIKYDNAAVIKHLENTIDQIAAGGIFDQAGGGFARYSVDEKWKVPHFEKMLYDNAQLISLYSKAFKYFSKVSYKKAVLQTIEFLRRELQSPEGMFFSSLDADSEGEEGKFYVWKKEEIMEILQKDADLYCDYFQVTETGNWENNLNILHRKTDNKELLIKYQLTEIELNKKIEACNTIILNRRNIRPKPALDDKIITSWNALAINGLCDAYLSFEKIEYFEMAKNIAEFITSKMINSELRLFRSYKEGRISIPGFLDDYALIINAFIKLYQSSFEDKWIYKAYELTNFCIENYFEDESGFFYYTANMEKKLIARKMEIPDNVIPGSNSVMANNLYQLSYYFRKQEFKEISLKMAASILESYQQSAAYYSNWGILLSNLIEEPAEIIVTGPDSYKIALEIANTSKSEFMVAASDKKTNLPVFDGKSINHQNLIYVCRQQVCFQPVNTVEEAIQILNTL
ncbi:MAG: thioredoxin domain-containing protein [Bacteroidales bacterium]